jgi:hypothetical protein
MKYLRNKRTGKLISYDPIIEKDFAFKYEVFDDSVKAKEVAKEDEIKEMAKHLAARKRQQKKPGINETVGTHESISIQLNKDT